MREQQGVQYAPPVRRASATREELAARRTGDYYPANPHRAGHYAGLHPEDQPYMSGQIALSRHPRSCYEEEEAMDEPQRPHTTALRYRPLETRKLPQRRFHLHWSLLFGVAMFVMLLGWVLLSALGSWWQVQQDDWHYGRPRTFQVDAVVGHDDSATHSSHFIAMNLNRKVLVIELPGGDPGKALIYIGPTLVGDGQDLTPITLTFNDVNGDGKPDMEVHILDQVIVFLNNGTKFVAPH
jgi:hypothetical protein